MEKRIQSTPTLSRRKKSRIASASESSFSSSASFSLSSASIRNDTQRETNDPFLHSPSSSISSGNHPEPSFVSQPTLSDAHADFPNQSTPARIRDQMATFGSALLRSKRIAAQFYPVVSQEPVRSNTLSSSSYVFVSENPVPKKKKKKKTATWVWENLEDSGKSLKKKKRGRPKKPPPPKGCADCKTLTTCEWRRGPKGPRTYVEIMHVFFFSFFTVNTIFSLLFCQSFIFFFGYIYFWFSISI